MKKIFWGIFLYCITNTVFADAIMTITTSSTNVEVTRAGGTDTVDFTVLNSSSITLSQLTVDPDFGISSGVSGVTTTTDTCTGAALPPSGTCNFTVQIQGNTTLPNEFILSPKVCAFNNSICSQPAKANRPKVIVVRQAYVANDGGNSIYVCNIDSTSNQMTSCAEAFAGAPLDAPTGLMMTSDGTQVYVANSGNGTVSLCTVNPMNGYLSCVATGVVFGAPSDIELNPAETFAYITYPDASLVMFCAVADDGTLNTCLSTGNDFDGPSSIVFNNSGKLAYVTNSFNNTVSVCTADVSTGVLSGCTSTGTGFTVPESIDLNSNNNLAFITNYFSDQISTCKITDLTNGLFNTCTLSSELITNPYGLVLSPNNSILYVTQPSSNSVYLCNVNTSSGALSDCAVTFTGGGLASPTGIVLN